MADSGHANVRLDDIVARVVPDPAKAEGATVLSGFVGKGANDTHIRVYADHSFCNWYDVPAEDVLHSVPLPQEQSPLGGSMLWVKTRAQIKPGSAFGAGASAPGIPVTLFCHGIPPTLICAHAQGMPPTWIGCTLAQGAPPSAFACTLAQAGPAPPSPAHTQFNCRTGMFNPYGG